MKKLIEELLKKALENYTAQYHPRHEWSEVMLVQGTISQKQGAHTTIYTKPMKTQYCTGCSSIKIYPQDAIEGEVFKKAAEPNIYHPEI